jgi:hypothetical protein
MKKLSYLLLIVLSLYGCVHISHVLPFPTGDPIRQDISFIAASGGACAQGTIAMAAQYLFSLPADAGVVAKETTWLLNYYASLKTGSPLMDYQVIGLVTKYWGLKATWKAISIQEMYAAMQKGRVVIPFVLGDNMLHATILYEIQPDRQQVSIFDPALGPKVYTFQEFDALRLRARYYCVMVFK